MHYRRSDAYCQARDGDYPISEWLKAIGATVIGTVGSDEKAATAWAHGCEHVIISTREDIVGRVREISGGSG
jgi:NADPH2:quinone reductase